MKFLQRAATIVLTIAISVAVGAGAWKLYDSTTTDKKAEKPPAAATVAKPVKEDDFNTVVLTEAAESRLGLKTGAVEKKAVRRSRIYGGEVTIPVGKTIVVSAPLGGILRAPAAGMPKAGQIVKKGDPILELLPLMTPEGRTATATALVDADGQVKNSQSQLDLAKIALDRATNLLKQEAGSQRNVDEARATYDVAAKTLEAVSARRAMLAKVIGEVDSGTAAPILISASLDGILRTVSALPGQSVASGGALFEVIDLRTIWVRVPVPVGDLDAINRQESIVLGPLSLQSHGNPVAATPVAAPPSANALSATVDVYYEAPNPGGRWIPGQRVGATISLLDTAECLTVPWSAIIYDIHGGSWVYERTAARTFVRLRVVVKYTMGSDAVLASGLVVGTTVVTAGSQELFASETGFNK